MRALVCIAGLLFFTAAVYGIDAALVALALMSAHVGYSVWRNE